uniref:HTH CENPB-type domain-containing protein n=1 Tax=Plectus sambesii TaxID=2011161 RepID=A0A914VQB8_9BILA
MDVRLTLCDMLPKPLTVDETSQPLDLSQRPLLPLRADIVHDNGSHSPRLSVIQSATSAATQSHAAAAVAAAAHMQPLVAAAKAAISAQQQPSVPITAGNGVLPTCTNNNLNSNWIAMKFGAAVGPNRMSYPREFKLMVIDYYYANGHNKYRTCKEFQITKSMLNGWLQKIDKIRQSRPGSLKSGRSGRRPQFPDIEKQLYALYTAHLSSGQKVGNRWIRETARALAQQQCSQEELAGMCQFSERWLSNFKKRYHINLNRDWSSGSSLAESSASSAGSATDGSAASPQQECAFPPVSSDQPSNEHTKVPSSCASPTSPAVSPHQMDEEDDDDDDDDDDLSPDSDDRDTPIDVDDSMPMREPDNDMSAVSPGAMTAVILGNSQPGQLPIHTFYQRFPWLCRRAPTAAYEPGRRGRKVQFPQVEKVLYERMLKRQASGQRVSNRWLQEEARTLAAQLCPEVLAEATKSARCMFSEHWLHNFKKRYGVSLKQQIVANAASVKDVDGKQVGADDRSEDSPPVTDDGTPPSTPSTPQTPTFNPTAIAAMLQVQQWFLQQCYLSSMTGTPTAAAAAAMRPFDNAAPTGNPMSAAGLPTMVPLPTLAQSVNAWQELKSTDRSTDEQLKDGGARPEPHDLSAFFQQRV